jgi:hypothetical protein
MANDLIEQTDMPRPRQIGAREADIVRSVLAEFGQYQTWRWNFAEQWEEAAQLILPTSRNTFYYQNFNWPGGKKTREQIDATGALALHRFCAIADSLVTPKNLIWHGLRAGGPNADYIMKDRATRLWFENATRVLFRLRYSPNANFAGQNYNNWQSLGAFGNATMYVDAFDARHWGGTRGLRYKAIPLGETFFGENHQGKVDRMIRWFRMTPYQAVQKWGLENLPVALQAPYQQQSKWPYQFLHCVRPRRDQDPQRLDVKGMAFESYYVSVEGQCLMEDEGGYRKFPFSVHRYDQTPGEVYGRGPAQIVLPALKTLNAEKTVYLKQGHRAADPVLLTADDGLIDFNLRPGALNKGAMTMDGKRLVDVLPTGDFEIGEKMIAEERSLIDDTFLVSLFKVLTDNPNMTATQVIELVNEKGMLVAPTLGRQLDERSQMIERELDLAMSMRMLEPMPPALRDAGGEYEVVDTSPLAMAAQQGEVAGFFRTIEGVRELVNITQDPSYLDPFNFQVAIPEIARRQGVLESWMASAQEIAGKQQARAQQQQRQQQIESAPGQAALINAYAKTGLQGTQGQAPA